MVKRLIGILKYIYFFIFSKVNPIKYAKSIGVNMGENVRFYGMKPFMFGSEPWLITLGNNVYITSGCQFVTHDGGTLILRQRDPKLEITSPIKIGNNVYIGINSTILPGVEIGDNVIVGAGSIVTKSLESNNVYAGIPAKKIKTLDEYYHKLKENSLEIGHLSAIDKEKELKKIFGIKS
ncbi:acyltransferase [Acinetobacter pittii]|uniref:acyltransferase n=1 Tax=Acinetobacter pittii TaxID=48296 RepID=UPI00197F1980|nr:acyltransferase [Acinetobacter pittii]MBN6515107.1 acyltransferase [Acinetobacter pittii]